MTAQTELPLTAPLPHPRSSARKLALVHIGSANAQALAAMVEKLSAGGASFTSDDLRDVVDRTDSLRARVAEHPEAISAVFTNARKAGLISTTGQSVPSRRKDSHGRRILQWRGCR
jgi:hypothetical protein